MALKGDRVIGPAAHTIDFFYNSTAEKGEVLVYSTAGSGSALDDANAVVTRPSANASGDRAAGVLLNDVVNIDLTRQHINFQKDEMQQGGKVTLLQQGTITTDMIESGASLTLGAPMYFKLDDNPGDTTSRGVFTPTAPLDNGNSILTPELPAYTGALEATKNLYRVGTLESVLDADNFAKIKVSMP